MHHNGVKKTIRSEVTIGQNSVTEITDKRGYGARWWFSVRHIDNLLSQGLPHLKIGARRVRILIPEADAWMKEKFSTRRNGPAKGTSNERD